MDVQSDAADPPSSEPQPSGKKKGFKLFGKRKPGSIFSIRGRAEEKEAAAVARSKALEGSPENAPYSHHPEQEPETEHAPEVRGPGPGPNGQADGALQDEGTSTMAATPSRPSICSMGSVRSMGFLLRLRGGGGKGGRGGAGERQVQTVSQPPPGRQRRGIKGLFSGVKFPANKGDRDEDGAAEGAAPPSPLLMSSRSNSVEIIKEHMTLTPRPPPRNHNSSSESEGPEPDTPRGCGSAVVPRTPVSLGPGTPQEPGDAGLSFLLADITSLLTFDSITAGGDIMADVAAEWDKASAAISARDTEESTPAGARASPKPVVRSSPAARYPPPTVGAVTTTTTRTPAAAAIPPVTPPRTFTATVKPAPAPSSFAPPGAADVRCSALSGHPFKPPSAGASASPAAVPSTFITVRSSVQKPAAMPSSSLVTLTSFSTPPVKTSTLITTKPPLYPSSAADPAPTKPPGVTPPYRSPLTTLSSAAVKPPAEAPVAAAAPAWEPGHAAPTPFTFTPVAYSLPSNLPFSASDKLDSRNGPSYQSSSAKQPPYVLSSFTSGESKASVLLPCPVQAKLPSSAPPAVLPKTTALPPAPLPPLPPCAPSLITSEKYAPSFAAPSVASSFSSTPTPISSTKPPSIPAPVPPRATPIAPAVQPAAVPAHLDKTPSVPASTPLPTSQAAVPASTLSSTPRPPALASTAPTLASKTPPLPLLPPFFTSSSITPTPSPVSPTPSPVSPTPAPMSCFPASKAPTSSFVVPSPIVPITRTPDPPITKPAPAEPTSSSITPTLAPMSCTPASKPSIPASVIPTPITPTPSPVPQTPDAVVTKPAPITPTPVSIPVSLPKTPPPPTITPGPARVQASMEPLPGSLAGMNDRGAQQPARREETIPAPAEPQQTSLPGPIKDKRPAPGKLVGLSKIPIVGGGRVAKPPVRDAHPPPHGDDGDRSPDSSSTPGPTPAPTPASSPVDERPRLSPQDGRGRAGAGMPTSRQSHHPEESQHPQHPQPPRAIASSPRDSKIPVKHGAQPTLQPRDPPRSKIPTSKVPVRRLGASKPAVTSTTALQMRK